MLTSKLHNIRCYAENKFLFLVAYDCNFRCPYCFENEISNSGKMWSRKIISQNMVNSAYKIINSKNNENNKQITLYGGEPLLKENFDIVKYIVEKGISYGFRFNAITNGFEIDNFYDLINKDKISSLQITIDGPPRLHNKTRILASGAPTFKKIINNIKYCLRKKDVKIIVRMNFNSESTSELDEILGIFEKNNWLQNKNFIFYATPLMSNDISCNSNANKSNNHIGLIEKSKNKDQIVNRGQFAKHINSMKHTKTMFTNLILPCFDIENRIKKIINKNSLDFVKSSYCAAHTGMLIFDPCGDLYTCWELVGTNINKIGSYHPFVKHNDKIFNQWKLRYVGNLSECVRCKYVLFCGGGCAAQALNTKNTIFSSYCDGFQLMFNDKVINNYKNNILTGKVY